MHLPGDGNDLDLAVNSLKSIKIGLTGAARRRIATVCREATAPARTPAPTRWLRGMVVLTPGRMAAVLAVAVMGFVLFTALSSRSALKESAAPIRLVSVKTTPSGGVSLQWSDGNQRVYKVLKSTSPRSFAGAETHAVLGNQWTDESPSVGSVVYYKVE